MDQPIEVKHLRKPRVLVAPLDWGLGHATRCIPLIRELIAQGAEVLVGAEGQQEALLRAEFPAITFLHLPGYHIRYSRTRAGLPWKMLKQLPKLIQIIKKEYAWLQQAVRDHQLDMVISDNRFGLHHPEIKSIFLTHQLQIQTPGPLFIRKWMQSMNYRHINRFDECWVPDEENQNNLAGDLSHPGKMPAIPTKYIGHLSRFETKPSRFQKGHLLFLLSGPEPQRSLFENRIIEQVAHHPGTATIVRGLPGDGALVPSTNMLRFYNHLPAHQLNDELLKAEYIISRSGYSTVMDLAVLQKKSILVPTPGQTEQEYLGDYLMKKGYALSIDTGNFNLQQALHAADRFSYQPFEIQSHDKLAAVIKNSIASLSPAN